MNYYQVNLNYERQTGEDNPARVKEAYLAEAISCADAENRVIEHVKPFIFGECEAPAVKKRQFFDIFPSKDGDYWYEAKVEMIVVDDDKEIRKAVNILIQAETIYEGLVSLLERMKSYDCEIIGIKKSQIVDTLPVEEENENN